MLLKANLAPINRSLTISYADMGISHIILNEIMTESIQSCVREVRTRKIYGYIVSLYQTNL
jgi:hypothetical protein